MTAGAVRMPGDQHRDESVANQGEVIGGRYELVEMINQGARSEVWRAWDSNLQGYVAVKRLLGNRVGPSHRLTAAFSLVHEHVVRMLDLATDSSERHCLIMELVGDPSPRPGECPRDRNWVTLGQSLYEYAVVDGKPVLDRLRVVQLMIEICDGVAAIHAMGLVHGDVSLEHVFLMPSGKALITAPASHHGRLTPLDSGAPRIPTHPTIGGKTPPEVSRGEASVDGDIRELGAILYILLSGRSPSSTATHVGDPVNSRRSGSRSLSRICEQAMATEPRDRYESVELFRRDLSHFLHRHDQQLLHTAEERRLRLVPAVAIQYCTLAVSIAFSLWAFSSLTMLAGTAMADSLSVQVARTLAFPHGDGPVRLMLLVVHYSVVVYCAVIAAMMVGHLRRSRPWGIATLVCALVPWVNLVVLAASIVCVRNTLAEAGIQSRPVGSRRPRPTLRVGRWSLVVVVVLLVLPPAFVAHSHARLRVERQKDRHQIAGAFERDDAETRHAEIAGFLDGWRQAVDRADVDELMARCDIERLYQKVYDLMLPLLNTGAPSRDSLRDWLQQVIVQSVDSLRWHEHEVCRVVDSGGGAVAVVYIRAITADGTTVKFRWWLRRNGSGFLLFDAEDLVEGICWSQALGASAILASEDNPRELRRAIRKFGMANDLMEKEQWRKAMALFEELEEAALPPFFESARLLRLALAYMALGRFEAAEAEIHAVLELRPDLPVAELLLATTYNELGRHEDALTACERYVAILGEDPEILGQAGVAFEGLSMHEEAAAAFERSGGP